MDEITLARGLHVLGVVIWIGGVSMVTTVLLPAIRTMGTPEERIRIFSALENRFAWQSRFTTLLTGFTGFYMLYALNAWDRYESIGYWWVHAMTAVWFIFTMVLFVLEPLILHKWFQDRARVNPEQTFRIIERMHRVLLTLSLITVLAALLGSHGVMFGND